MLLALEPRPDPPRNQIVATNTMIYPMELDFSAFLTPFHDKSFQTVNHLRNFCFLFESIMHTRNES